MEQCKFYEEKLREHGESLKSHITEEYRVIETIRKDVQSIKDNHLVHIQIDMTKTRTNVEWLLKYHWIVATAAIGGLVVGFFNLMK